MVGAVMADRLTDLRMVLHHETDKAVLVSLDGERDSAVWLPKSAIEIEAGPMANGVRYHDVTLPERLAIDKGLV